MWMGERSTISLLEWSAVASMRVGRVFDAKQSLIYGGRADPSKPFDSFLKFLDKCRY
jgi:hypothetical protein